MTEKTLFPDRIKSTGGSLSLSVCADSIFGIDAASSSRRVLSGKRSLLVMAGTWRRTGVLRRPRNTLLTSAIPSHPDTQPNPGDDRKLSFCIIYTLPRYFFSPSSPSSLFGALNIAILFELCRVYACLLLRLRTETEEKEQKTLFNRNEIVRHRQRSQRGSFRARYDCALFSRDVRSHCCWLLLNYHTSYGLLSQSGMTYRTEAG